ncbi:MAG: UvrD-helicase domain-containing protein [Rhodospirillales bacterium]|nr:UvrD-helicase domain-containing protein [Rhodospirillales bacterium]
MTDSLKPIDGLSTRPPPSLLDGLNETQAEAVRATEGPVLVLAGAGTGKTRVLTTRLAHILASGRARPWQVLAVTFTNKAAREMRERVARLLDCSVEGWWVGTFHAACARMLRGHAERVGLKPSFGILDTDDQLRLLKQLIEARNIDAKKLPPRLFSSVMQRWKDRGLTPERVTEAEGADAVDGLALPLYRDYQERLSALNACDFGDLLLHALTLFRDHPDVAERYRNQFRYLLVDEYQDTNVAQYLWLRALAQGHHNLCCVGDDDQSIYSWRGAEVGNILRFERDFPGAKVIRLECNYRSTSHILAAASGLIAHNRGRLGKTLWTTAAGGEKVCVRATWDGEDEARVVCGEIESRRASGHALGEIAVLVRAGFQTREFEERLIILGIPYRVIGGARFYERQEIRDAIGYFRIVVRGDDDLAFERIVNTPKRGLGAATLRAVHQLARGDGLPLSIAAARLVESDELKPQARGSLGRLLADIGRWREMLTRLPHPEVARALLDESGYTAMWQADRSPEAEGRLDNLKELVVALAEFESLPAFLEHVSLVMDNDEAAGDDKVGLMTLHAAKGLEFDTVFLPGWEEGIFPNQRALDEGGEASLEEERRLAYVGLTRARRRAIVTYAASRMVFGTWQNALPSRFVKELPAIDIDHTAPTGLFRATPSRAPADGAWPMAEPVHLAAADTSGAPRWPIRRPTPPLIEGRAERVAARPEPSHPFTTGQRVFHQKFGYGAVRRVDGDRLEIDFEKAGNKTVIHSFVETA